MNCPSGDFFYYIFYFQRISAEYLIENGVEVDYRDDWNETALNDAKKRSKWTIVDLIEMHSKKT